MQSLLSSDFHFGLSAIIHERYPLLAALPLIFQGQERIPWHSLEDHSCTLILLHGLEKHIWPLFVFFYLLAQHYSIAPNSVSTIQKTSRQWILLQKTGVVIRCYHTPLKMFICFITFVVCLLFIFFCWLLGFLLCFVLFNLSVNPFICKDKKILCCIGKQTPHGFTWQLTAKDFLIRRVWLHFQFRKTGHS